MQMRCLGFTLFLALLSCTDQAPVYVPPPKEEVSTDLVQAPSRVRLKDAMALTQIYKRIFKPNDEGYWQDCGDLNWCQRSMFKPDEARYLGSFDLEYRLEEFKQVEDFNLNYVRQVRSLLARECANLVRREWDDPKAANVLVTTRETPQSETLRRFAHILLGIEGRGLDPNMAIEAYHKAFLEAVESQKAKRIDEIYVATCVALAMDPLILVY